MPMRKYLYAHGNPIGMFDPSGRFSLKELAVTASISATINVALAIPNIVRHWDELSIEDIAKTVGKEALSGAVTGVIGGVAGKFALRLAGPGTRWFFSSKVMRELTGKAIEGAGGAAASQIAKELYSIIFEGKKISLKDSAGRVFIASTIGFVVGGIAFKVEPVLSKTVNGSTTTAQGFQQTLPWIEMTFESVSAAGVAGALVSDSAEEVIGKWFESELNLDN